MSKDFSKQEILDTLRVLIRGTDEDELRFSGGTHIIFEDGNYRKSDVEFCLEEAKRIGSLKCYLICKLLNTFDTKDEIEEAIDYAYDPYL